MPEGIVRLSGAGVLRSMQQNLTSVEGIAFALRDLFESADSFDVENPQFRAFLAGYRERFALDEQMVQTIPMFLRMHNLLLYAKLVRALDVGRDDLPNWLKPLHDKLTQRVAAYCCRMAEDL